MGASRDKCRDCRKRYETQRQRGRTDICDACLITREQLVNGEIVDVTSNLMKEIQRKMCRGNGTARAYIDSLRKLEPPRC